MADYGEGYKYQRSVTAYLASLLSKDRSVKDYQIFYEVQEFYPFDDIVLVVNYYDSDECSLYCIQAKSGKIKLEINKYMKGYDEITQKKKWNSLQNIGKINEDNIQFWYFACQNHSAQTTSFQKDNEKIHLQIKERTPNNKSIIYKKTYKLFSQNENVLTENRTFFDDFYIFLGQPNAYIIVNKLKDMWKSNDAAYIIDYLDKYFTKYKKGNLNKIDFEHELLRIYLSDCIVTPMKILPFKKESALAWNDLTLSHNVTIVKNEADIETCLFGSILQSISDEIAIDQWNSFVDDGGRLSKGFKQQLNTTSMKPESLKDLLIHMWIRRIIPLILKTNNPLQLLKEFSHLDQHYVIIDSNPGRRYDEMMSYSLKAIKNLGDGTDKLLQSIFISMQGREPTSLYSIINGERKLAEALSCSDVLKLTEPRKVYLSKDCLKGDKYILFIIGSVNKESLIYENYEDKISIYCHFDQSDAIYDKIKADPKFRNYKIYRLRLEGDQLVFAGKSHENLLELNNFLIDQHGNRVYSNNKINTVPILGKVKSRMCWKYLQRYMCKGTVSETKYGSLSHITATDSTVTFSGTVFPEKDFFKEMNHKICVVIGEAGIGKTTLLRSLLQACDSQYYVLYCNLSRLQGDMQRNTQKLFEDPLNFLWDKQESLSYKHFLNIFLKCRQRLVLILDSFDEVAPTCEEQVLEVITKLNEEACLAKIVIASRLLTAELLSQQFDQVGIAKIEHFSSKHNGDEYIENWGFNKNDLQDMPSEFAANPLYLDMLRTISNISHIDLNSLNLWTLYEYIVDLEITRYCKRIGHVFDEYEKENILKFHCELAVKLIFGSNRVTEKFALNKQVKFCNYLRLGFIKYFNENEEPTFVHRTFADFFAVNWLIKITNEEDRRYIYQKMLKNVKLDILRIHSEQFPLHKIVNNSEMLSSIMTCEKIKKLCRENKEILIQRDGIGRLALHIAAMRYRNDKGRCLATIIQCMRERGYDLYSRDELLNWTWIDICENDLRFFSLGNFLPPLPAIQETYWSYHVMHVKNSGSSYVWEKVDFDEVYTMIMHYPFFFNIISDVLFVKYFDNKNFIRYRNLCLNMELTTVKLPKYFELVELGLTPLHMAVIHSNINVAIACLERGDKINCKDIFGCTPLYYSIGKGESEIVKLLLDKGANMVLRPDIGRGFDTFRLSLQKRNKKITEMLIERVNINVFGSIWLYDSIRFGDIEVVEMLLKAKADPNAEVPVDLNNNFEIVIFCKKVLEVFTQWYSSDPDLSAMPIEQLVLFDDCLKEMIHYKSCWKRNLIYMTRPIHAAIHDRRKDIVELLLKNHADVNLEVECNDSDNYYDCSPFYCAISCRSVDIIELLLRSGANVNYINKQHLTPLTAAINDKCINFFYNHHFSMLWIALLNLSSLTRFFGYYYDYLYAVMNELFKTDRSLNEVALLQRKMQVVDILLKHGADVNFKDERNATILNNALEQRNWTMIEFLLENAVNAHFSENVELTHLVNVVPTEHIKIIELLLKKGVDPNVKSACDVTPLYVAARKRNPDMVRLLLEHGATLNIETRTDMLVAKAIERGEFDVVIWLSDLGESCSSVPSSNSSHPDEVSQLIRTVGNQANINFVEQIDITRDITKNKLELIDRLLEYGADLRNPRGIKYINAVLRVKNKDVDQILIRNFMRVHKTEIESYTAVGYAAIQRNQAMIEILSRNGENVNTANKQGYTPLVCVVREEGDVKLLLDNGADVNLADEHGATPLIVAIETSSISITKILIENKVNINYVSKCGLTPLIASIIRWEPEITDVLLNKGADVNFATESGLTPLYVAVLRRDAQIINILLSYGAICDIETCGNKLLFHAIISGHLKILFLILDPGIIIRRQFFILSVDDGFVLKILNNQANVNAVNDFGLTPLHLAIREGHCAIGDILLERGADPNQVDRQGRTALHYAVLNGRKDMVKNLLRREVELSIKDKYGLTSLDYAKFYEYHEIIKILKEKSPKRCYGCTTL